MMEKRLKDYLAAMDKLLTTLASARPDNPEDAVQNAATPDGAPANGTARPQASFPANAPQEDDLLREHLTQIRFFQHERLIHLIVTCLFAVLAFATFFALFFTMNAGLFVLFLALLVLLIPYIRHYYILENGVQRMYAQYDRLRDLLRR